MKDIVSNSKITMYIALFNLAAGPVLLLEGSKAWIKILGFILIAFGVYCVHFFNACNRSPMQIHQRTC